MHLRNSWTRSMSSCCQRQSSCGTSVGRRERLDRLVDLVVPGDVGHEVLDEREGAHRLDRDRLVEVEVGQARLAGQARPAVDLGAARAALGGLAVPAHGEVGRLVALDPVEGVEDDHPLLDRHVEVVEVARSCPALPRKTLRCASRHRFAPSSVVRRRAGSASSSGIAGSGAVVDRHRPSPPSATTLLRVAPRVVVGVRDSRAGCGRRGSRSAGGRCARSPRTRSACSELEDEVPARVVGRDRPSIRDVGPARPERRRARSSASSRSSSTRKMPTRRCIDRPGARAGCAYGSSPSARSSGAASSARARPGPGPGRRAASPVCAAARAAAAAPVRAPNTSRSESELPPSRFAPCIPPATSPAANRPGDRRRARSRRRPGCRP